MSTWIKSLKVIVLVVCLPEVTEDDFIGCMSTCIKSLKMIVCVVCLPVSSHWGWLYWLYVYLYEVTGNDCIGSMSTCMKSLEMIVLSVSLLIFSNALDDMTCTKSSKKWIRNNNKVLECQIGWSKWCRTKMQNWPLYKFNIFNRLKNTKIDIYKR